MKIRNLVLSTITAGLLIGCGGGSSSSSGTTSTDVTVERGAVFGATVTDANGQVATQKAGSNVYSFATTPVYPISASGGIIDVDGDGQISTGDVELTTVLTSYSTVVTPITTYLGDTATTEGKAKLAKLKEISGVSSDDDLLKKVPSNLSTDVIVLTNALFDIMNDNDTTNDDFVNDYDNSEFKTRIVELKTEADKYEDKKELLKALEEKVVTNLGLTKLTSDEVTTVSNGTDKSTTLKVADLTRFVSFDKNDSYWYDDNTVADGKVTFKSYDYDYNSVTSKDEWTLNEETNPYVTITPDTTNPYKLSYVDPDTKEEGTLTILSTKKVDGFSDLNVSKTQRIITKIGTELEWYRWDWENPVYYLENNQEVAITDIDGLEKSYILNNAVINLDNSEQVVIKADGKVYLEQDSAKSVGTWKKENNQIVIVVGKETKYLKVVEDAGKYYIEESTVNAVGYVENDTIYTGSNLDDFIEKIKAPAPVITSDYRTVADENQTGLFFSMDSTKPFQVTVENDEEVTFLLSGTDASSFNINSSGIVTFKTAPDFETRQYYNFDVVAKNKVGRKTFQNIQVKINDLEETVTPPTDETIISKSNLVGKKLVVANETFFFEENRVVLGDSGADYTTILSYSSVESNKITLSNGDIIEKASDGYKMTFESGTSNQEIFSALSLSSYTSDELNVALADVEQTSTSTSFVSGKHLNFDSQFSSKFFEDGIYEESGLNFNETTKIYESYNCSGLWKDLGNNKIGVTCQDNGTDEVPDGIIDSNSNEITFQFSSNSPKSKDKIIITDYSKSEEVTIDSFKYMTIGVIDSDISGKTITLSDGITYTFNSDKTFTTSETGVTPKNWETSAFLNIYYEDKSMKTLVFTNTPAVGVVVLENSAKNNFSSEVKTITNIK